MKGKLQEGKKFLPTQEQVLGWAWLSGTGSACSLQQPCLGRDFLGQPPSRHTATQPFVLDLLLRPLLLWQVGLASSCWDVWVPFEIVSDGK